MLGDELSHLKHVDDGLATEDCFEVGVSIDIALVGRILKIVLLDIDPQLLDDL